MYRLMYQDIRPLGKRCKRRKPGRIAREDDSLTLGIKTVSKRFTVRERGMRHFQRAYCDQFIFIDDALANIGRLNQVARIGFPLFFHA